MNGKEAIIKRVINDAAEKAREKENAANERAGKTVFEAKTQAEEYVKSRIPAVEKEASEIVARRKTVALLESRKIMLAKKREAIDAVFKSVAEKLLTLDSERYKNFVEKLILENAEIGDEIVLASRGLLDKKTIEQMDVVKRLSLKISDKKGGFSGGVLLIGKTSDKDLSFEAIVKAAQEDLSSKAAELLFGKL